jgi:allophanate hydrolase subunit 2
MHLTPDTLHDAQLTPRGSATIVRAVLGPQADACTTGSIDALLHTALTVSHRSDRSGLRLDGIRTQHRDAAEVISDGCAAGSVQVPGGGTPIVLLADRGTTGGYPKVATIASVDMPRLARLRPGDTLHLDAIDVAGAERLRRDRERILAALPDMLEPVAVR